MRRAASWCFLAALGLLIGLSIAGAFLGAGRAKSLFNSIPLAVFWFFLAALLVGSVVISRKIRRSPGLLVMHVGSLLVLGGAMWGSDAGHAVAERLFGVHKVPAGFVRVSRGATTDLIFADDSNVDPARAIGRLPFSLSLTDFQIAYYPAPDRPWPLLVLVPSPASAGHTHGMQPPEDAPEPQVAPIDWAVNTEVAVPFTKLRMTVLEYLPRAQPVYDKAKPVLEVTGSGGTSQSMPAEVGQQAALAGPEVGVKIVQVLSNLRVQGMGQDREVMDAEGPPENPALKVELKWPDGKTEYRYVMARFSMHGDTQGGVRLKYRWPEAVRAQADPDSRTPAMQVLLRGGGSERRLWLIPGAPDEEVQVAIAPPPGSAAEPEAAGPVLCMVPPEGEVKAFLSDVAVYEQGRLARRQVVEVNQPLNYGGYQLYQHSFDREAGNYTILGVTSDSGLWWVYAGFALLVIGVFWQFWAEAIMPKVTGGDRHGD